MKVFLGIDGGGSKTSCLLGNGTSVLGAGAAGGSNVVRVGEVAARQALSAAIGQACAVAHVEPAQIDGTCIGVAGAARPQIAGILKRALAEIVSGEVEVVADMVIALEAAFAGDPGVVVIAGTGSIAYGVNAEAQTARAGGWGFTISDEGSGHWIGRTAITCLMRAYDQGNELADSHLFGGILKSWGLSTAEELVLAANASTPPDFAGLFPAVLASAECGDPIARQVLRRAGTELAGLAGMVMERLFSSAPAVQVAMCGGVFANGAVVRESFAQGLASEFPAAAVKREIVEPVYGALARARRGRAS